MNRFFSFICGVALIALGLLCGPTAHANRGTELPVPDDSARVFQCLMASGEFQNVTVYSMTNGTLRMTTLNSAGSQQAYELPYGQWSSGRLTIPCSHDAKKSCGHVFANGRNWEYDFASASGDCG